MRAILMAAALLGEAPDAKEDLLAAIKKLAEASGYAWTSTPKNNAPDAGGGQGGRRRTGAGPGEGKTEKDGAAWVSMKVGEASVEALVKGDKVAVKSGAEWKAAPELQGGGQQGRPDPAAMIARGLRGFKTPAATAEGLVAQAREIKAEAEGLYTAELTEEGAKELLAGGLGRPGGQGPAVADAKGAAKFWVKDGVLVKVEQTVSGKMTFGQREVPVDRTTTVDIKDVGSTKVEIPEEAKAKLQ